jgi:hypothetical protein
MGVSSMTAVRFWSADAMIALLLACELYICMFWICVAFVRECSCSCGVEGRGKQKAQR